MISWIILIAATAIAYLVGSINSSIIISKIVGTDIREHGSGNAGATNMLRTYGKKIGILTLLLDALKGVVGVGIAIIFEMILAGFPHILQNDAIGYMPYACGAAVVVGHNYPVFFQFKGGKGIATSAAVIFMLDWRIGFIVLIGALLVMVLSRYVSLGSIVGAALFPTSSCVFTFFIDRDFDYPLVITSVFMGALAIYRHKANLVRLIHGTEAKLGQKKKEN